MHPQSVGVLLKKPFKVFICKFSLHNQCKFRAMDYLPAAAINKFSFGLYNIFFLIRISSSIDLALVYWLLLVLSSISSIIEISLCENPSIAYRFKTVR